MFHQKNIEYIINSYEIKELNNFASNFKIPYFCGQKYYDNSAIKYHNKTSIATLIVNHLDYKLKSEIEIKEIMDKKYNDNKTKYYKELPNRLYNKTTVQINDNYDKPCLLFGLNSICPYGGQIKILGKSEYAYRVSYALKMNIFTENIPKYNEFDEILQVSHGNGCDKHCIEQSHLELKKAKNENNREDKIRDNTLPRGENHSKSIITNEQAQWILDTKGKGKTQKQRADEIKTSIYVVQHIDNGSSWAHLSNNSNKISEKSDKKENDKFTSEDWVNILKYLKDHSEPSKTLYYNNTPCDIWTGPLENGYGKFRFKNVSRMAHVFAAEAKQGFERDITLKPKVRHLCNKKSCVNPEHLSIGTNKQNMEDAIDNGSKVAKLTRYQVMYIKLLLRLTQMKIKDIANIFGVVATTISSIKNGKAWERIDYDAHQTAKIIQQYYKDIN